MSKKKIIVSVASIAASALAIVGGVFAFNSNSAPDQEQPIPKCDGITITENCEDDEGKLYSLYVFHEAEPEKNHKVEHPAVPAKTHKVEHPAQTGTRQVKECIKTNISNKYGTCALSQCRDGMYSGSSGRGTCSYHGGVARSGGPWYTYRTETYVIKEAWTETVVDTPAKEAWTETVVDSPAKEAWTEKVLAE